VNPLGTHLTRKTGKRAKHSETMDSTGIEPVASTFFS
jgi:hypothetical protein